ncbi:MAG: hypothetical protein KGH98_03865 [Candidatus Micrarchaeota archaeon]|nr:hypothetical protein [Candidatus Micrarchaeota archaeon]
MSVVRRKEAERMETNALVDTIIGKINMAVSEELVLKLDPQDRSKGLSLTQLIRSIPELSDVRVIAAIRRNSAVFLTQPLSNLRDGKPMYSDPYEEQDVTSIMKRLYNNLMGMDRGKLMELAVTTREELEQYAVNSFIFCYTNLYANNQYNMDSNREDDRRIEAEIYNAIPGLAKSEVERAFGEMVSVENRYSNADFVNDDGYRSALDRLGRLVVGSIKYLGDEQLSRLVDLFTTIGDQLSDELEAAIKQGRIE